MRYLVFPSITFEPYPIQHPVPHSVRLYGAPSPIASLPRTLLSPWLCFLNPHSSHCQPTISPCIAPSAQSSVQERRGLPGHRRSQPVSLPRRRRLHQRLPLPPWRYWYQPIFPRHHLFLWASHPRQRYRPRHELQSPERELLVHMTTGRKLCDARTDPRYASACVAAVVRQRARAEIEVTLPPPHDPTLLVVSLIHPRCPA
jgi:hypothetical protein